MDSAQGSIPETPIITFSDWVSVPGSPCASDHALPPSEDASGSLVSFEREIDALDLSFDEIHQTYFPCQPDTTLDWQSELNNAFPSPCILDSLSDDTSYSAYTLNEPLSPVSVGTLINSPNSVTDSKLAPAEGAAVDYQLVSSPSLYLDTEFIFQCQPWSTAPTLDACTSIIQVNYDHQDCGQYWLEQLPSQHEIGAASVVVAGHTTDVDASAGSFALTCVDPVSPLSSPSAEFQQDNLVVSEEHKSISPTRLKRCRDVSNKKSAGYKDEAPQKRKRSRQDTTKRFACTQPNCRSMFARTYNLNVHISSVHCKERPHGCKVPGCERAFSRKHDLDRHYQSAHTNLGSPRKTAKQDGQAAERRKRVKKEELIE